MKKLLLPILVFLFLSANAIGQNFDIYVCDGGNFNNPPWQILKFDQNGENHEVFINEELSWPQDIVFIEDQDVVLISNLNTGRITRYQAESGNYIDNFATGIDGPTRMRIGEDSLLYVLQWGTNGKVLRYELDGTFVDEFTETGVTAGIGFDWDTDGNMYVSSYNGGFVRKYNSNGADEGNFISSGLQGPTNLWFDAEGDMYVNNWNGTTVKRFDAGGVFKENFITGLSNPEGIAIMPNGNLLIGNGGTQAVKLFDPEGNFIEDIVPSGTANLLLPNAVVLREKEALATSEAIDDQAFLQSNLGTHFYLSTDFTHQIDDIQIYDLSGTKIDEYKSSGSLIWEATDIPGGIYILQARARDGVQYSEKVVVQR